MSLSESEKTEMRLATREAAESLIEDMRFMRNFLTADEPANGSVRQISVHLRKLLMDGQLNAVAAPRIGRVNIPVYDSTGLFERYTDDVVSAGIAPIFGFRAHMLESIRITLSPPNTALQLSLPEYPVRDVTVDQLLADRMVRIEGQFITRKDFLEFVLYHAFGAHYAGREKAAHKLVRRIRYLAMLCRTQHGLLFTLGTLGMDRPNGVRIDFAHAQTFSTAYFLVNAPDILRLEALIEAELAGD